MVCDYNHNASDYEQICTNTATMCTVYLAINGVLTANPAIFQRCPAAQRGGVLHPLALLLHELAELRGRVLELARVPAPATRVNPGNENP